MFGYIRVHPPELLVKEYDFYQSTYCGLCRSMGRCTGCLSRATLSYDFVFLALVRMVITGEKYEILQGRCLLHPTAKKHFVENSPTLDFCARASALLVHGKVLDDKHDEKGLKKIAATLFSPVSGRAAKRVNMPRLKFETEESLFLLRQIEERREVSLDLPADISGDLLGRIFAAELDGVETEKQSLAYDIGFHTGRFIFAVDAADDIEEDSKKGEYNPFLCLYGENIDDERRHDIKDALTNELAQLEAAILRLDFSRCSGIKNIIKNIIYYGLPMAVERALFPENIKSGEENPKNNE